MSQIYNCSGVGGVSRRDGLMEGDGGWGVGGGGVARSKPRFQYPPPNSAITGDVFISAHPSTDAVGTP